VCDPADFTIETMPGRFAKLGDRHREIDRLPCSLERLLELAERQQKEGLGDAPWPPQYKKQAGEPPRVQPSRRRMPKSAAPERRTTAAPEMTTTTGRRTSKFPLIEIGRARRKEDALAGFERWKVRHEKAAAHLEPADVLVDSMRGRSSTWTRVRVNLQHVPVNLRPKQGTLDPDFDPGSDWVVSAETPRRTPSRARKRL
jgi:hypothetical protein